MSVRARFMKQVFNIDNYSDVDLFCCVVAKHNIRTQNKHLPYLNPNKFFMGQYELNGALYYIFIFFQLPLRSDPVSERVLESF